MLGDIYSIADIAYRCHYQNSVGLWLYLERERRLQIEVNTGII